MKPTSSINLIILSVLFIFITYSGTSQNATLTINEDPRLTDLLKLQKQLEQENKLSINYTIQLYYGELNPANETLRKYKRLYSAWPATIEYETPNYKVWAGNFASRLEAERALKQIQKDFSAAFILKPERRK